MKFLFNKIHFLLSLPKKVEELKELIGHLQPVGIVGEIQKIFGWSMQPKEFKYTSNNNLINPNINAYFLDKIDIFEKFL